MKRALSTKMLTTSLTLQKSKRGLGLMSSLLVASFCISCADKSSSRSVLVKGTRKASPASSMQHQTIEKQRSIPDQAQPTTTATEKRETPPKPDVAPNFSGPASSDQPIPDKSQDTEVQQALPDLKTENKVEVIQDPKPSVEPIQSVPRQEIKPETPQPTPKPPEAPAVANNSQPLKTQVSTGGLPQLPEGWEPVDWELHRKDYGRYLSRIALMIMRTKGPAFYRGAADITSFCPAFYTLNRNQKENVWVAIVAAISNHESSHRLTSRSPEGGVDRVTGDEVYSEGLLQISYQDARSYRQFCSEVSWDKDKNLDKKSEKKTIFNPIINLSCGMQILHWQVAQRQHIAVSARPYWSTISPTHQYSKLGPIQNKVKRLKICQPSI